MSAREILQSFTLDDLPPLDVAVIGALELGEKLPQINTTVNFKRPIVIGSGNALATGRIIFDDVDAVFADESTFAERLRRVPDIDGAVLISASGGKHAVSIAESLKQNNLPMVLFTNNPTPEAAAYLEEDNTRVFPKNREPYTYNTSTYLSMILAKTGESTNDIKSHLENNLKKVSPTLFAQYDAFTFVLPGEYGELRSMLRTKFDELFGPKLIGRFFMLEEMKHAKTVVPSERELFINLGVAGEWGGKRRGLFVPLPENSGYAAALSVTYYLVGLIQRSKPAYFQENIESYCRSASKLFGQDIKPIVE